MKVAIITYVAQKSGAMLRDALINNGVQAELFDLKRVERKDFRDFDSVFSYGASCNTLHNHRFNLSDSVRNCVSKPRTFDLLKEAGVASLPYCTNKRHVPKEWGWCVVRKDANGRKAEGLEYADCSLPLPDGELFTPYFEHKTEYRIVVFNGDVVGRYEKVEGEVNGENWHYFELRDKRGFGTMDEHILKASKALGIDYAGFDVVANTKKDFRILEANSAARLDDEAENAIVEYYINL